MSIKEPETWDLKLRLMEQCEFLIMFQFSFSLRQYLLFWCKFRGQKLNPNIFFSNFSGASGISPGKIPGYPAKKVDSLGSEGHTELFGPHPFTWKTPTPPENIQTQKFRFGFLFPP